MEALDWQANEAELCAEWQREFGKTGLDWSEIREAHRYGWDAALRPEFSRLDFADVEADLGQHWWRPQSATEETAWDYVREAARAGWQAARGRLRQREQGA